MLKIFAYDNVRGETERSKSTIVDSYIETHTFAYDIVKVNGKKTFKARGKDDDFKIGFEKTNKIHQLTLSAKEKGHRLADKEYDGKENVRIGANKEGKPEFRAINVHYVVERYEVYIRALDITNTIIPKGKICVGYRNQYDYITLLFDDGSEIKLPHDKFSFFNFKHDKVKGKDWYDFKESTIFGNLKDYTELEK